MNSDLDIDGVGNGRLIQDTNGSFYGTVFNRLGEFLYSDRTTDSESVVPPLTRISP